MFPASCSRWPFLAAVALFAAAVSDVLVESIANTGVFGRAYFDTDDSTIIPSLVAAALLAASVIGAHMLAAFRRGRGAGVALQVAARPPLRDLPYIFAMQFLALFAMESLEQFAAHGRLAGGLLWLGGPVLVSVGAHAVVGTICALVARWLMHVSIPRFASLVWFALEFVLCARSLKRSAVFTIPRDARSCNHAQAARVWHISGRAPPRLPTPT